MIRQICEVILDALLDTAKLLPFLFLTYLLLEWIEHRAAERMQRFLSRAGHFGPAIGAGLGVVPQCGFSAAAAGLYSARVISVGTLAAVFLSTSDEMLPVMIAGRMSPRVILITLGLKCAVALLVGYALHLLHPLFSRKNEGGQEHIHDICTDEHCHCERGIWRGALHHTLHIAWLVLVVNLLLGALFEWVGAARITALLAHHGLLTYLAAGLVGLIPNCAASVVLTELYVDGVLPFGAMLAGLLPGAGAGILVLLRTNRPVRRSLLMLAFLLAVGISAGLLASLVFPSL
ncbi:MAG: arsenic efflux protein [Clostridia bacterium]|nr:arsenic efflux protein [Clostridia bacterium]